MILRILFNLNRIDTLKLKKKNNLNFQFCYNSFSFKDYFRQRKFPNMLKKKILPVISKPDITFSSFMYVFQILQILFTNSHLVSGCLMLNSEIGFWRWSEDGLFTCPKQETSEGCRILVMWGDNFKMMMFSARRAFLITGTDMWVSCPSNKSNSECSFTDSANLKNHFVFHLALKNC